MSKTIRSIAALKAKLSRLKLKIAEQKRRARKAKPGAGNRKRRALLSATTRAFLQQMILSGDRSIAEGLGIKLTKKGTAPIKTKLSKRRRC